MAANPGALRFNTDSLKLELYDGNQWVELVATSPESQPGGARGVFFWGYNAPSVANLNTINYITISTTGNAIDFGDIISGSRRGGASCASSTRGLFAGGLVSPTRSNVIDFITISSTGNTQDFGDLLASAGRQDIAGGGTSSATRGFFAGGTEAADVNTIEYVTIASTGNAVDFGDLLSVTALTSGCSSSTRGVFGGGLYHGLTNVIQVVTISTTGNSADFGDLLV